MIRALFLATIIALAGCAAQPHAGPAAAGPDREAAIRALEDQERRAVLAGDIAAAEALWHPALVVNGPNNIISPGRDAVVGFMRSGVINYHRFDRVVERVTSHGDVAFAMGSETVQPKAGPMAGQTLRRRYTTVWRLQDGRWRMIARHANLLPPGGQAPAPSRP